MASYLERYQQGEYEPVWTELLALGPAVRYEPVYSDATAVAQAMMERIRHNLALLIERLHALRYHFLRRRRDIWQPLTSEALRNLDAFEKHSGPLPMTLHTWFTVVGVVDFCGAHPTLSAYSGLTPKHTSPPYSDPLVLWSPVEQLLDDDELEGPPYMFPIAPDACQKANTSGAGLTFLYVPDPSFDGRLYSADWGEIYLVDYLRHSFAGGGFASMTEDPYAAEQAKAELEFLTNGLLPF